MGPVGTWFITVSIVAPSIAVFVIGSDVIHQVGTGVFLCFAAAAIFGVAMSCVYGELGAAFPSAGGEYTILRHVSGKYWANGILGLNLLGFSISLALSGHGVATYLGAVVPGLPEQPLAALLIVVVAGVAVLHVQVSAVVSGSFLFIELMALATLTALGFRHMHQNLFVLLHPAVFGTSSSMTAPTLVGLGAATASAIYAFNGYGAAIFFGEDMRDGSRTMAPVVLLALAAGVILIMPPIAAVILGAPDLRNLSAAAAPVPAFIEQVGGPSLGRIMSLGVALAVFNTMIAIALMAGRQLYATAHDELWPHRVSDAFASVHPRWASPWVATLVMGGCGLLACLLNPHVLVRILGNSNVATYAALCLAALYGRRMGTSGHTTWSMPGYPAPPILGLLFLLAVIVFDLFDPAGRVGLLVTALTVVASLIVFTRNGQKK